jgi:hypothetical protein
LRYFYSHWPAGCDDRPSLDPPYPARPAWLQYWSDETSGGIVRLQPDRIKNCIVETTTRLSHQAAVFEPKCKDPNSGGRMIDNIITNTLLPEHSALPEQRDGGRGDFRTRCRLEVGA